jgi:hypothetical protein
MRLLWLHPPSKAAKAEAKALAKANKEKDAEIAKLNAKFRSWRHKHADSDITSELKSATSKKDFAKLQELQKRFEQEVMQTFKHGGETSTSSSSKSSKVGQGCKEREMNFAEAII